jgi:two-component system OmpR family sensor kinase
VFDRFWRANDTGRGVGLGLPIAKQIADAHGGKLSLESPGHQGAGCRFELQLPR